MASAAYEASNLLEGDEISTSVLNPRFLKPFDEETVLRLAQAAKGVVVVEENMLAGGFGEQVRNFLARSQYKGEVITLGLPDFFVEHGTQAILRDEVGLTAERVATVVREMVSSDVAHKMV
jgi:1-deoxy-D-xylulose-5-phosphate synthase